MSVQIRTNGCSDLRSRPEKFCYDLKDAGDVAPLSQESITSAGTSMA